MKNSKAFFIFNTFKKIIFLFLFLEVLLFFLYTYKQNKDFKNYVSLKIESKVHNTMTEDEVKEMYNENNKLNMVWAPFVNYKLSPFKGKYNTINSEGFRKTINFNKGFEGEKIRIYCLGGSTMYGIGTNDGNTIPSILSQQLRKKYPNLKIEVLNLGIPGFTRDMELILLQEQLLLKDKTPKLVIFYDGVNEVSAAYQNGDVRIPTNSINRIIEFNTKRDYTKRLHLFANASYTYKMISYLKKKLRKTTTSSIKELPKKIVTNYRKNLELTNAISKKYNFKVFNFFQPVLFLKNSPSSSSETKMKDTRIYFKDTYLKTYAMIKQDSLLNKNPTFTDISNAFDKETKPIYTDICHTGIKGNEIIVNEILKKITPSINKLKK